MDCWTVILRFDSPRTFVKPSRQVSRYTNQSTNEIDADAAGSMQVPYTNELAEVVIDLVQVDGNVPYDDLCMAVLKEAEVPLSASLSHLVYVYVWLCVLQLLSALTLRESSVEPKDDRELVTDLNHALYTGNAEQVQWILGRNPYLAHEVALVRDV